MNVDRCTFCGSEPTKGGMGMRDPHLLRIAYCRRHRLHAIMLWAQYQFLIGEEGKLLPMLDEDEIGEWAAEDGS